MKPRIEDFRSLKHSGIAALTAYDYPTAKILDESDVDIILVGDSLGMVVLGYPDTTNVTMEEMLHHCRAVARGARHTVLVGDLPARSYATPEMAVENARQLMATGMHGVKLEGGISQADKIAAIAKAGIPVMAHIGMLPQSVRLEGGYKVKGRSEEEAEALLADARAVEAAGAFAVVCEIVAHETAVRVTRAVNIPTIGIGSGRGCDGQILVTHDLIGFFPWFTPPFVKPVADVAGAIRGAADAFVERTRSNATTAST